MKDNNVEKEVLRHFIILINDQLKDLSPISIAKTDFDQGKSLACYEVMSLIIESCKIFDLSPQSLE